MGKRSARVLNHATVGQHLALPVAAHLARTQLVPDPLSAFDGPHVSETLDVVASGLARVAPLYVTEPGTSQPRELSAAELEGANVRHGATQVELRDGRTLAGVTMRRADLRQAIAVLKTQGLEELRRLSPPEPPPAAARAAAPNLLSQLGEIEELLTPPLVAARLERANRLMVGIAREARSGVVSNLAMRLMSEVHQVRGADDLPARLRSGLSRLRAAIDEIERAA